MLTEGPVWRLSKQSMGERLVIGENSKISTFKYEPKITERRIGSHELTVKGRVFLLGFGELLGVENQQSPDPSRSCCRTVPRWVSDASTVREMGASG